LKITNKFNLPQPFIDLATKSAYSKGRADYSVTEIISPPRIQRLRVKHWHDMEQDVSDMTWSLMGTMAHNLLEKKTAAGLQAEERLYVEVDGVVLSGAMDLQEDVDGTIKITDYKFTSAWALREDKIEWVLQQNIYAWMVGKIKGKKVSSINICAFVRDWSRREAAINPNYPQASAQMVPIQLMDSSEVEKYVRDRIELHRQAKVDADFGDELLECTDEERWTRETKFAVKKEGRKTAVRVLDTQEEAEALVAEMPAKDKAFIEIRKGESVRCTGNFCGVAKWCSQFNKEQSNED
jgi:hypothetical protein